MSQQKNKHKKIERFKNLDFLGEASLMITGDISNEKQRRSGTNIFSLFTDGIDNNHLMKHPKDKHHKAEK